MSNLLKRLRERTEYRIVRDSYSGYEVQVREWWWPFWKQFGGTNTHRTLNAAKDYMKKGATRVVYGPLTLRAILEDDDE